MLNFVKCSLVVALALALGACGTAKDPAASQQAAAAATTAGAANDNAPGQLTGSRIPRKTSDRMIRGINAAGAKETFNELPPSPGPKVN